MKRMAQFVRRMGGCHLTQPFAVALAFPSFVRFNELYGKAVAKFSICFKLSLVNCGICSKLSWYVHLQANTELRASCCNTPQSSALIQPVS